jgi:hypothetical protein
MGRARRGWRGVGPAGPPRARLFPGRGLGYAQGVLRDTSAAALDRYYELLGALSPEARLEKAVELTRAVREMAVAGIRAQYPDASSDEIRMHLALRLYGPVATKRMFGRIPEDAR